MRMDHGARLLPRADSGRTLRLKNRLSSAAWAVFRGAFLIGVSFIILYPLIYMLSISFRTAADMADPSVVWIPKHLSLEAMKDSFLAMDYPRALWNTVRLGLFSSLLQVMSCAVVGYGFARFRFPLKRLWFAIVVFTMLVPAALLMPSLYMRFRFFDIAGLFALIGGGPLNLIDTPWPLLLLSLLGLGTRNGLYIYLLRNFFSTMPRELEESGRIDGAGSLRIFLQIMLPNAVTIMVTVFLFAFCWQWTDVYQTDLFLPSFAGIAGGLASLETYGVSTVAPVLRTAVMQTGVMLTVFPILLLFLLLQRAFVQGVERSGIVG